MKFEWQVDFDAVAGMIGTVYGIADEASNESYKADLVRAAHFDVSEAFDEAAAATASTGNFPHMWEYGVPGITRGPARYPNPTSPEARLYVHELIPLGGAFGIEFVFREAVARNPQPTTASTGVSSKYLQFLSKRKYVFREKARITEDGETVNIHSTSGRKLFVPFYGQPSENPNNDYGYMMFPGAEGVTATPGAQSRGTFGTFWKTWWESTGDRLMGEHIKKNFAADVNRTLRLAAHHGMLKPAGAPLSGAVNAGRSRAASGMRTATGNRKKVRK